MELYNIEQDMGMMQPSWGERIRSNLVLRAPLSAIVLWACLWLNLNSGFWNIQAPSNMNEWLMMLRAILPFGVLPIAILILLSRRNIHLRWLDPSLLLLVYGMLAAVASMFSPEPLWSLYWSVTFLATILVAWIFADGQFSTASSRQLLHFTWIATFIVAALIAREASSAIFGHAQTGYGAIAKDLDNQSRSSGVARWAAVPGLVCLVRAFHSRQLSLIALYAGLTASAFFIVYRMQSRGAVFGVVAALLFALVVGSHLRRYALPFVVLTVVTIVLLDSPATVSHQATAYLERGQSRQEFLSMTGRTRAYRKGVIAFEDAPILGRGQWTDRLIFQEHVHNSYLQALLNAGILGGLPYLASWICGWILFFRLYKQSHVLSPEDRLCLLEAGTVMMFFTVRSVPETTTASFSVDLLVMLSVYVYLECLALHIRTIQAQQYFLAPLSSQSDLSHKFGGRYEIWNA